MPAEPTRRETKRDVHETTTCCACSEYLDYEQRLDQMISKSRYQIAHAKSGITKLCYRFGSVNLLVDTMPCTNILVGTLFSVIRQTSK